MPNGPLRALIAWFCIAATTLAGVVPAQGLVLCLEPDGSVTLEVGTPESGCGGCAPSCSEGRELLSRWAASEEGCPCVDIPLIGLGDRNQLQSRRVEVSLGGPWLAPAPVRLAPAATHVESPVRQVVDPPRPAERLAHIRTVVLLV